jgi:type IV pilus assembly protein PilO
MRVNNWHELTWDEVGLWPVSVKMTLIFALGFLISTLGYGFIIKTKLAQLAVLSAQERLLKSRFESIQRQSAHLQAYRGQVIFINQHFGDTLKQISKQNALPAVLEELSEKAQAAGMQLQSFNPKHEENHDSYTEIPVTITVPGTYYQLADFLSRLCHMKNSISWHQFTLGAFPSKNRSDGIDSTLLLRIRAKIYQLRA